MQMQTIAILMNVAVIVLTVGLIMLRQLRWTGVGSKSLRLPIILAVIAVAMIAQEVPQLATLAVGADLILFLELLLGIGFGAAMGRLSQLRLFNGGWQSRGGALGVGLWIALIAIRSGISLLGTHVGLPPFGQLMGPLMLMLAANRLTAALVLQRKVKSSTPEPQFA